MSDPSARMLRLLSLLQSGRDWPAGELAERLGTSARTLRRDLDRLRDLGYPVSSTRGPGGSYRLVAGTAMPPLLLSDEEAVATVVGLRIVALGEDAGTTEAAEGALRKLEQVLPNRLRQRMRAILASTDAVRQRSRSFDVRVVRALGTAAHAHQHVRFGYTNRSGDRTERRVEPYRQVLLGRRWYLLAWDEDRADWRTFRLDRISEVHTPGTTFAPRELPAEGPVSFVQDSARYPITRHQGVIRFHAPLAQVAERLIPEAGSLEPIDEHTCRYVTAPDSWQWLAITLAMVDVPYTIEGPPDLIAESRALAERIATASSG